VTTSRLFLFGLAVAFVVTFVYVVDHVGRTLNLPAAGKASEVFVTSLTLTQAPALFVFAVTSSLALTTDQRLYMCLGALSMFGSSLRSVVKRFREKPKPDENE
jgi:hypothetical protein